MYFIKYCLIIFQNYYIANTLQNKIIGGLNYSTDQLYPQIQTKSVLSILQLKYFSIKFYLMEKCQDSYITFFYYFHKIIKVSVLNFNIYTLLNQEHSAFNCLLISYCISQYFFETFKIPDGSSLKYFNNVLDYLLKYNYLRIKQVI